jgi:putative nucleotidyltransferase with HDIG domain
LLEVAVGVGFGGGGPKAPAATRGLLADFANPESRPARSGLALVQRLNAAEGPCATLFEEVRANCDAIREQLAGFGPELAQSGLLAILELRLPETYAHAWRVARSSVGLARAMGLADIDVRTIKRAALLHDIGKMAVPDRLLAHRGPLGDHEIAVLRMHVTIGADLVADVASLDGVAPVIAATHERYDGTGYPSRAAGDDIPIGARIIAVADCYDAMVTPRPYREPVGREEAHNEMVRCSGSHFDPAVLREWVALLGAWGSPVPVTRLPVALSEAPSEIPVRLHR